MFYSEVGWILIQPFYNEKPTFFGARAGQAPFWWGKPLRNILETTATWRCFFLGLKGNCSMWLLVVATCVRPTAPRTTVKRKTNFFGSQSWSSTFLLGNASGEHSRNHCHLENFFLGNDRDCSMWLLVVATCVRQRPGPL